MEETIYTNTKVVTSTLAAIETGKDLIIHQGGTYSGKTFGILVALHSLMKMSVKNYKINVVGQTVGHLKDGALGDYEVITDTLGGVDHHNATDKVYSVNGSTIKFLSVDKLGKAKGGKRDILFINECNEINYNIAKQLLLRTNETAILDYNPTSNFWLHDKILPDPNLNYVFKRSTYKDNPSVSEKKIRDIEGLKDTDPELYRVYALGLTGNITGLIFNNVRYVDSFPEQAKKVAYGLDFGFTNDPTSLVRIGELHGELFGEELIYKTGLTNSDICKEFERLGLKKTDQIFADAAEPKSIEEIKREGWNIKAAKKGADSIKFGIDLLKKYPKINLTHASINWKKESKNYKWREDKNGDSLNIPIDSFNHCWDAARYYAIMKLNNKQNTNLLSYA